MARSRILTKSVIVLSVFVIISMPYMQIIYGDSKVDKSTQELNSVEMQNCNCIAFRLDDIQGYWLNKVQIAIMESFQNKNEPLTIGIIGSEQFGFGNDQKITNYVKKKIMVDKPLIEIANHGWNHENFTTFDKKMQDDLIKKTNERLNEILDISPKVFIPPLNEFNKNTITVLEENNFTHFSSMQEMSNPPYPFQNVSVYHFPETSTTGKWNEDSEIFEKISSSETFERIKDSQMKYGFSVVTMHPQEFSILENNVYTNQVDWKKIHELEILIDEIQDSGLKIVFLSQINENVTENKISIPSWLKQTYQWWSEGKISDIEFSNAINYLQEHGYVKLFVNKEYDTIVNFVYSLNV